MNKKTSYDSEGFYLLNIFNYMLNDLNYRYTPIILIPVSIYFISSFVYVSGSARSLAPGVLAAAVAISIFLLIRSRLTLTSSLLTLIGSFILFISGIVSRTNGSENLLTLAIQSSAFGFLICVAALFGLYAKRSSAHINMASSRTAVMCANALFVSIGLLTLFFRPSFLGYENYAKNIIPFAEPSHFALAASPFILLAILYLSFFSCIVLLTLYAFIAIEQPSLILFAIIVSSISVLIVRYIFKKTPYILSKKASIGYILLLSVLCAFLFLDTESDRASSPDLAVNADIQSVEERGAEREQLVGSSGRPESTYFRDRLRISPDSSNLTVLVFLQGWDDARRALADGPIFGYGFQTMGSLPPGEISERIRSIAHMYKNRNDGGSLAPKIIFEFGYAGLVVVLMLVGVGAYCFLRLATADASMVSLTEAMAYYFVAAFLFELFLRGYGYFSPGVFLAAAGLAHLFKSPGKNIKP